jgi:hypothetical protein
MEDVMQYFPLIIAVCGLLMLYSTLLFAKVVTMKIKEDHLRLYGQPKELQDFLKKKNLRHVLTLGIL